MLKLPIKNAVLFGMDKVIDVTNLKGYCSQLFGENLLDKYKEWGLFGHNGLDIPCKDGEPVYATHDGVIYKTITEDSVSSLSGTRGLGIYLRQKELILGRHLVTIYWHLKEFKKQVGDTVSVGDLIGLADNTGVTTGTHLHFGCKYLNQNLFTLNEDNGYGGYVDPLPLFNMTIN